jgi:hypothetical protein
MASAHCLIRAYLLQRAFLDTFLSVCTEKASRENYVTWYFIIRSLSCNIVKAIDDLRHSDYCMYSTFFPHKILVYIVFRSDNEH